MELFLRDIELFTSGVEAHQAFAIVIMSPQGFNGSPYLPEHLKSNLLN